MIWHVFVEFCFHRLVLFLIALLGINAALSSDSHDSERRSLPKVHSARLLIGHFEGKLSGISEIQVASSLRSAKWSEVLQFTRNPYIWLVHLVDAWTGLSTIFSALLVSNIIFVLFLIQCISLVKRMVTTDVATATAVLVVLWPTSYEFSLGTSIGFTALMTVLSLRFALDRNWMAAGLCFGLLSMSDVIASGIFLFLLGLFISGQRYYSWQHIAITTCFALLPAGLGYWMSAPLHADLYRTLSHSALVSLAQGHWLMSGEVGLQVLAVLFFLVGACAAAWSHAHPFYRFLPLLMLTCVLCFSPIGMVASRLLIAFPCFMGISSMSSPNVWLGIRSLVWILGILEAYTVFR